MFGFKCRTFGIAHSLVVHVGEATGRLTGDIIGAFRGVGGGRGANVGRWMGRRVVGSVDCGGSFLVGLCTGGALGIWMGARVGGFRGAAVTGTTSVRTVKVIRTGVPALPR